MRHSILAGGSVFALAMGFALPAQAATGCGALSGKALGSGAVIESATAMPADAAKQLPAFCEVKATAHPVSGSSIGMVFRLPENWNGKILGLGGGGWAGNVTPMAAMPGLQRGYAVAQTDGGHPGTDVWSNGWVSNPEAAKDFSYRAIHETAVAAKRMVALHYGRAQARTYYQGCSTGGRMGLMEAQRFPADYDGIIAGAPVYTLQVQSSALLRGQTFGAPGAAFSKADLALVNAAVLNACDARDGQKDGILTNPRSCTWNPASIQCSAGAAAGSCLSPAQVQALQTAYDGRRTPKGDWAAFPLERGGEAGWAMFVNTTGGPDATRGGGMLGLQTQLFGAAPVDMTHLTPTEVDTARGSAFAKMYEAGDPNVAPFLARGGKLILWHGESDPGPSPVGTIDYYRAVAKRTPRAAKAVRLFLAPGVGHCGGGPGADNPDTLTALEAWVEQGKAPATVIASKRDGSMTRPLCPYPATARYLGQGDVNDPKSYRCQAGG